MLGRLNQEQAEFFLQSNVVGRLGCHADGKTYVVPVTYAYKDGYIFAHTREGLKVDLMRKNPDVCFEVDSVENMANWRSVIGWGTYEELNGNDADKAMQTLVNRVIPLVSSETSRPHFGLGHPHRVEDPKVKTVVFRIKLDEVTGRFEKSH